jgi:pimeloyl-ACP methyl ester carboxylesterase
MWALRLGLRVSAPAITSDRRWFEMIERDLSRTTLESFLLSIASLRRTDLRPFLSQIDIPAMGMYGARDVIVSPNQWQLMQDGIANIRVERFNDAGHFIMLDEPERFMVTVRDFLDSTNDIE